MTQNPHAIYFPDIEPNGEPKVRLKRIGPGRFELLEKFRYLDHKFGMIEIQPFETDLTTVHFWDSWITPKLGEHTPAALVHDAMIGDPAYVVLANPGTVIDADDADRIFHDAMQALGVGAFRRLTMWSAARLRTALAGGIFARLWLVVALGSAIIHFLDVVDVWNWHPLIDNWSFEIEWAAAALSTFLVGMAAAALAWSYFKPLTMQSLVFALGFVPVLPMLPVLIAIAMLGPVVGLLVRP